MKTKSLFFLFFFISWFARAQNGATVSGRITDYETQQPLPETQVARIGFKYNF